MEEEDLKILRDELKTHWGAIEKIAKASVELKEGGYHRHYITKVLRGKEQNLELILLCQSVLIGLREERKQLKKEIVSNMQLIRSNA